MGPSGKNGNVRSYNLKTSLKILKDADYQGLLCIERTVPKEPDLVSTTRIRDIIKYPKDLLASVYDTVSEIRLI